MRRPLAAAVRVARHRPLSVPPGVLADRIAAPRAWSQLLAVPGAPAVRRVKTVDGTEPTAGAELHVLFADRSWTVYRIEVWRPEREVRLRRVAEGQGDAPGTSASPRVERLIIIPQGPEGSEAEWSCELPRGPLGRLLGADRPSWEAALDQRLDALAALVAPPTGTPSAGSGREA